jgi:hypothetical protein
MHWYYLKVRSKYSTSIIKITVQVRLFSMVSKNQFYGFVNLLNTPESKIMFFYRRA